MIEFDKGNLPEMNAEQMLEGLNAFAKEVHGNAEDHGWWVEERHLPEILMLCVSELAEALEEYREGRPDVYCGHDNRYGGVCERAASGECTSMNDDFERAKPEGVAIELADCIIRILDYCGYAGIDIEEAIRIKHRYNKSRQYRHGGKKC